MPNTPLSAQRPADFKEDPSWVSNGLNLASIAPDRGGRYSPNLYRWLTDRRFTYRPWMSRVYRDAEQVLWIGTLDSGDLFGIRLMTVLCLGPKAETACWAGLHDLHEVTDFWDRYVVEGRCAVDPEHRIAFVGDETRWQRDEDRRSCLWCGKGQQTLRRWTQAVEREQWCNTDGGRA